MDDAGKKQKNYVGYEYKEIAADSGMVSLLLDGYENFGWEVNESLTESGTRGRPGGERRTVIRLKRDRKIINKTELTRQQRNFKPVLPKFRRWKKERPPRQPHFLVLFFFSPHHDFTLLFIACNSVF